MAIQEYERVKIRKYLARSPLFQNFDNRLENVITNIQSIADGGLMQDSSTEDYVRELLEKLDENYEKEVSLSCQASMVSAEGITMNPMQGLFLLRSIGRQLVGYLADVLNTDPFRDTLGAAHINHDKIPLR